MYEHKEIDEEFKGLEYLDDILSKKILDKRIIFLHGEVSEDLAHKTTKELLYLSSISTNPIKIILNSVGGEVYHGLLIFDTIESLVKEGIEVTVEARGLAASMGALLLQAGSKRTATKHTRILIHEVSSVCYGKTSEIQDESVEIKKLNDLLRDIIADRTHKTKEEIDDKCKRKDVWFSAEEALEWGLIDSIV